MNGKLTNRKKQAIETRNKIYSTALNLMDRQGLDNITVEDICRKSGVAVGSFYHYFKSKNDIFFEIYKRGDEYFENVVGPELVDEHSAEMIKNFFFHYAQYNIISGIDVVKQLYNTNNKQFIAKGRYMQSLLKGIIEKGQQKKEVNSDYDSEYIVDFLFTLARGIVYDWCLHEGNYDLEKRMKDYIEKMLVIFEL